MPCATHVDGCVHLVADPVDVITGANTDVAVDFKLAGSFPLLWRRYYSSARNFCWGPLGWGHTHEYDHRLQFDVDGLRYTNPAGALIAFPALLPAGATAARSGAILQRVASDLFRLRKRGQPGLEFQSFDGEFPARLTRVFQGTSSLRFFYNATGALEGILDASGRRLRVEHDQHGCITAIVPEDGTHAGRPLMLYRYDAAGNLAEGIDFYRHTLAFCYDADHRLVQKRDRRGYSFFFEYDAQGRCIRTCGEDGLLETRLRYQPEARTTSVTRADGGEWTYLRNERGSLAQIIDPYGGTRVFIFNERGRILEEADANGNRSRYVHHGNGGPVAKLSPQGRRFEIGQPPPVPYAPLRTPHCALQFEYGDLLPFASISLPPESAVQPLPELLRKLVRTAAAAGVRPGPVCNELGIMVKEVQADGTARRWSRDPNGNIHRYHDRQGSTYTYEYASWNLRTGEIDPLEGVTSYRYTPTERVAAVTDPGGTTSEYEYDLKDRCIRVRRHGTLREEYRYDLADNLIEKLDAEGNRLLQIEIGPGNLKTVRKLASGETQYFAYDEAGRCLRAATDGFEVLFGYDQQGRRIRDFRDGLGVEHTFRNGRLATTTIFGRFTVHYAHSRHGVTIQDPAGRTHRIRFLGHGLVSRACSNGSSELAQYDSAGRCLLKATARRRSAGTWSRAYHYSPEGELLREEDSRSGVIRYEYDAAHRLIAVQPAKGERQEIMLDPAGNLLKQPGLDAVSLREGNRLATANGDTFEYNHRNHIATRKGRGGSTAYEYDSRDMLTGCTGGDRRWSARYDPLGRRISKSSAQGEVRFFWDSERLAAEIDPDGRLRIYGYADAFAPVPLLFLEYDSQEDEAAAGRLYFIFANQIGAPVLVEDEEGRVVWSARLSPYGAARIEPGSSIDMPLRFPGHYCDAETGLHYNRFRYYSPELGRYLQSDPHGLTGGTNVYAYPANPLASVDVRGLTCPDHPAGFNPNCDDCSDNEPTLPRGIPSEPDPATVAACGDPSEASTWRQGEVPYQNPPEMYDVKPGQPLDVSQLDPNQTYLWVVAPDGTVKIAPENQPGFGANDIYADGRPVKHGDLTPGPDGGTRGPARGGGELNYNPDTGHWEMNNESSYTFAREDGQRTNGDNLQAAHDLLTQSGTDTSNIDTVNSHGADAPR